MQWLSPKEFIKLILWPWFHFSQILFQRHLLFTAFQVEFYIQHLRNIWIYYLQYKSQCKISADSLPAHSRKWTVCPSFGPIRINPRKNLNQSCQKTFKKICINLISNWNSSHFVEHFYSSMSSLLYSGYYVRIECINRSLAEKIWFI